MKSHLPKMLLALLFCVPNHFMASAGALNTSQEPKVVFEENKGQVIDQTGQRRSDVLYMGTHGDAQYIIKANGVSHQLHAIQGEGENRTVTFQRIDMEWLGSSFQGKKQGYLKQDGSINYYFNSGAGTEGVSSFGEVRLFSVYPGVDVRVYSIDNVLEYDFELAPNADWHQIQIRVSGTNARINSAGELELSSPLGIIRESAPRVFQEGKKLDSRWVMNSSNTFGFEITNAVKGKAITIDPVVLIWSNQIGGSGNETAEAVAVDGSGNVIIAGNTNSLRNIATSGSHQATIGGLQDAYLAKFDPSGKRIWATYYGSVGNESGQSCAVDGLGNVYLAGQAGGAAPNSIATTGSYQATNASGSFDLYLAKFNSAGLRQWATYYGGTGVENYADVTTDAAGNILLAGITNSTTGIATTGAHQTTLGGSTDGFLVKFTGGGTRIWATYYGGSLDEGSQISCATDVNGNVALAGETRSTNNIASSGAYQQSIGGNQDAYVVRFNSSGVRSWGSYIGGTASDRSRSVAIDGNGNVVLAGWTSSTTGIATTAAYQTTFGGGASDAFISSFNQNGTINWSTYKGSTTSEQGYALATENSGNIFVLTNGPTAIESFSQNGSYNSGNSFSGPFYGALLNICSGGNGVVLVSGQANNNALVEKYQVGSVSGLVFNDANQNCQQDASETIVSNMRFLVQPGNQFVQSDNSGRLSILSLPDGAYTIYPDTLQSAWYSTCGNAIGFNVINGNGTIQPIGLKPKNACSAPDITIYSSTLRPCVNNQKIRVTACNKSTATVNLVSAYADVDFDANVTPTSSTVNFFQLGGNSWRFVLGDITPGSCVDFNVFVDVSCSVVSGQSLCMQAKLFPADSCALVNAIYPGTQNGLNLYGGGIPCTMPWDTSALTVKGLCQNGSVFFDVVNTAGPNGNMMCYSQVRIFTDGILTQVDSVQLLGGEVRSYVLPATGQTMRMEVDQHPLSPFYSTPSVTVELCGSSANWTPGLVNALPANDASPAVDVYCAVADEVMPQFGKRGYPTGVTSSNLIYPNRQLQYFIEFTNTSNDTVFNAIVRDTLDLSLNPFSVSAGGSSHPYQFRMYGNGILEWRFNNMNLPPATSGDNKAYVSFTVEQKPDLPDNTVINNKAYVTFNSGSPTPTNGTLHTVSRQLFSLQACPPPTIAGTASICQGSSTTLSVTGSYLSYLWNTGATTSSITTSTAGTYTITVTDFSGCVNTASRTVVVNSNPTPTITGNLSVCFGSAATLNASSGFVSYLWNTGATTSSISTTTSGNYTVTVTNSFGCTGTATQTATINPKPTPTITGTFDICQGNSALLNATPGFVSYLWSNGATSSSIGPTTAGTYTVTVTNANGCTGVASQAVTVAANPAPVITGIFTVCQGNLAILNATSGFNSYLWSNGATTSSINTSVAGTYSVTVTNASGCTGSKSQVVTVNPNPSPSISGVFSACQGLSATLTATAGFNSYLWSNGASTQTINPTTTGTYSVTVTNANGCTGSASQAVTINPNPTPAITGTSSICQGAAATLTASAGFASYNWSTGATTQTINPTTAGTYTVTVTNANGCSGSVSQQVTLNSNPTPSITGVFTVCQGANASLVASAGFSSYLWSTGATTQSINPSNAGTYTVTVTNASGCTGSVSQSITVNPNPTVSISGVFAVCQGASATLTASAGFNSYLWSTGAATQTINPTTTGTYTVTVTNANGCTASTSQIVTINPKPTPTITGTFSICQGTAATLTASAGFASYNWSTGATTQTINPTTAGTYTVTVTNANGCTGSVSQAVTVGSTSNSTVNANRCPGTTYTLPNGQVVSIAGTYTTTLIGSNGCDSIITTNLTFIDNIAPTVSSCPSAFTSCNPVSWIAPVFSDNCSFSVSSNFQPGATLPLGTNTITYTATDAGGNIATCSFVVTVVDYTISFNKTNVSCNGGNNGSATAVATGTSGVVTYLWNTGATTQTISNLAAGNYTVTVTNGTCSRQATVSITQPAVFTASITPNGPTTFCQGGSVSLTATAGASYAWSTGAITQAITVSTSGSYGVTVTNAAGCTAIASPVTVTVNPNVTASVSISANPSGPVAATTSITFTASPVNGGSAPVYQWKKNGVNVGTNSITYTSSGWVNNDVVQCVMTSNANCVIGSPANSNSITISVTITAGAPKFVVSDITANAAYYYDSTFTFVSSSPLSTTVLNGNTNAADVYVGGGFGYVADGVTLGRVYRSSQAGTPSVASRNLRSNTGAALNQATGVYSIGDTLYLLDKKGKAIYSYTLSQSFTGTTNLNAFAKKSLANQNITAEALGYDGTNFFVLDNGNTKAIYRYPIGSTGTIVRSRPLQTPAGVALTDIFGLVADGSRVWVTDSGTDMVYAFDKAALYTGSNTVPLNALAQFALNSSNLNASGIALTTTTTLLRNNLYEAVDASLMAWPNPTSGNINIRIDGFGARETIRLSIFDLNGRMVLNHEVAASLSATTTLDLSNLKSGIYAIVAEQGDLRRAVRVVKD